MPIRSRFFQVQGLLLLFVLACAACTPTQQDVRQHPSSLASSAAAKGENQPGERVLLGSEQFLANSLQELAGKRLGVLAHPASQLSNGTHLVDTLWALSQMLEDSPELVRIFAPEHGLRTWREAGAQVPDERDPQTGLPTVSLYGKRKAPEPQHLRDLDVLLVDLQDVGVRYYTYTSALTYTLEACARAGVAVWVLDRPNPMGDVVGGPVRDENLKSYVGLHPLPLWHGLTLGEFAKMALGEGWVKVAPDLRVIPLKNWKRRMPWAETGLPWRAPSPNLPTVASAETYGLIGWLEGTRASVGRGTAEPFTLFGFPEYQSMQYQWKKDSLDGLESRYRIFGAELVPTHFTPLPKPGYADNPKFQGQTCWGLAVQEIPRHPDSLQLAAVQILRNAWNEHHEAFEDKPAAPAFFTAFFQKLAGDPQLAKRIQAGERNPHKLMQDWATPLALYKQKRAKYLLYD